MVCARITVALVLLSALLAPNAEALRSDIGRRKVAVAAKSADPPAPSTQPSTAVVAELNGGGHKHEDEDQDDGAVVRCRFCGAAVAATADYVGLHDTTKAVGSKAERVLGADGELHTFVNPSRKTLGVESELYTKKATFFNQYNWRDVRCPACKRHVGWKFHHDDLQYCINAQTIETLAEFARAQKQQDGAAGERERRAQVVDQAFAHDKCVGATHGWWSYEVCYKREVRQYHEEPDGRRPSDWSMGKFVPPEQAAAVAAADPDAANDVGSAVVHYFAGGQHCDENGEQRSTRVAYTCCKSKPAEISVDAIVEPSLCSYVINICVPGLCDKTEDAKALESALEAQRHADVCEREMTAGLRGAGRGSPPLSFTALRWSTVISEASSELDWARNMQFKA
ncbi:hypothetical protein PybrP1_000051 [[Pythium] brassicae (nom. inval.)]|nr:hypothetical protein PybrP1_000051 [[Pythium] brassicae (nom. inval.)]